MEDYGGKSLSMNNQWDIRCGRPVVDGKVWNPQTNQVEEAGLEGWEAGPPSISIIWHNLNADSNFKTVRRDSVVSVDKVYVEIAQHIKAGKYRIVSVSASAYFFVIICISDLTSDQFDELCFGMFMSAEE